MSSASTHRLEGVAQEAANLLPHGCAVGHEPRAAVRHRVGRGRGGRTRRERAGGRGRGGRGGRGGRSRRGAGAARARRERRERVELGHHERLLLKLLDDRVLGQLHLERGELEARRRDAHARHVPPGRAAEAEHARELRRVAVVEAPLLVDLLLRAREDERRNVERALLGLDAARDRIRRLGLRARHRARGEEVLELVPPERVAGHHEGRAERRAHERARLARVRVVPMHCVELAAAARRRERRELAVRVRGRAVGKLAHVRPERLLVDVGPRRAAGEAHDVGAAALAAAAQEALLLLAVGRVDRRVADQAREEVDAVDGRVERHRARELDDVLDLPARVRVAAELHRGAAHEAVEGDHHDVERLGAEGRRGRGRGRGREREVVEERAERTRAGGRGGRGRDTDGEPARERVDRGRVAARGRAVGLGRGRGGKRARGRGGGARRARRRVLVAGEPLLRGQRVVGLARAARGADRRLPALKVPDPPGEELEARVLVTAVASRARGLQVRVLQRLLVEI
jgi:hypothetical protein